MVIYLVGAIRDGRVEDIAWREQVIDALSGQNVTILNPLAGKTYDPTTRRWAVHGIEPVARYIFRHDLYCVKQADLIVANMTALSEGYPSIGSLVEIGAAVGLGKLVYLVIDKSYTGHENPTMYALHPFLAEAAAVTFESVPALLAHLTGAVDTLSGRHPRFGGSA